MPGLFATNRGGDAPVKARCQHRPALGDPNISTAMQTLLPARWSFAGAGVEASVCSLQATLVFWCV